jgi:hypothetical protein
MASSLSITIRNGPVWDLESVGGIDNARNRSVASGCRYSQGGFMTGPKKGSISVVCPCCQASLTIDVELKKVIAHEAAPAKHKDAPDLSRVDVLLREQAARREAIFRQSTEDEKSKAQLLERKFAEALKKSKDQPVEKPTRDIDLD